MYEDDPHAVNPNSLRERKLQQQVWLFIVIVLDILVQFHTINDRFHLLLKSFPWFWELVDCLCELITSTKTNLSCHDT